jgi:tetratricopeptide (TPR) repeat protein
MKNEASHKYTYPLIILTLALIFRFWNIFSLGNDFYANFLSDCSTYKLWAAKIASGGSYGDPVFMMGPLYPYFLALNLALGISFNGVLYLQALLGAATCLVIYYLSRNLFGQLAGLFSGIIAAFYAPYIFYNGLLLSETLQVFLLAIALLLLISKNKKLKILHIFCAGILIGLAALAQGTLVLFGLFVVAYWLIKYLIHQNKTDKGIVKQVFVLVAGLLIGILPATLHNSANGDLVLISANTGINFYVGNNARATGTYDNPPGLNLANDFTGRKVAEKTLGKTLKSSQVSSFWANQTVTDIKKDFGHFVGGIFKKAWLYLWYFDIPQAESIQLQNLFSPVFKLPLLGFGAVLVLGIIGLILSHKDEKLIIIILLFLANLIGVSLFFVIGRFRLAGALPLLVLSGAGLAAIITRIKQRDWAKIGIGFSIAIGMLFVICLPRPIDKRDRLASAYNNIGIYYYYKNDLRQAFNWYRKAIGILPTFSGALNNMGTYFYLENTPDSAQFYFYRSWAVDSTQTETAMNLGRLAEDKGDTISALAFYEKAKALAPFGLDADNAIAKLRAKPAFPISSSQGSTASFETIYATAEKLAATGQYAEAQKYYEQASKIRPDDIRVLNNLGFAYQAQKKYPEAAQKFSRALMLAPENAIAYNNLAGTLYQMGQVDSAEILWEKALKLDRNSAQIKKNLDYIQNLKKR